MTTLHYLVFVAAVQLHGVAWAQDGPLLISTITDASLPASAEMMKLFREKVTAHDSLFKLVGIKDTSTLLFQADCMARQSVGDPYVCFYTLHYSGASNKTLMGGGVNTAKTANEIADGFLSSVAQDIVENMKHAERTNSVESLEACFLLTQSSCAVPGVLVPELKVKTLNLSQYLQKGGLKK